MTSELLRSVARMLVLWLALAATATVGAEEGVLIVAPDAPVALGVMTRAAAEHSLGHVSKLGVLLAHSERPTLTIDGRAISVELVHGDSGCDADQAAALAADFVAQGRVAAIIGPNCSSACLAVAPVLDEAGYTSFTPSCSLPALSEQGFTSFHRLVGADTDVIDGAARYLYELAGARRIALLHSEGNAFYQGLAGELTTRFTALGGEIVLEALLPAELEEAQLATLLEEIGASEVDWLYCACSTPHTVAVLAGREAAGLATTTFFGNELNWAHRLIDALGSEADGIYGATPLEPDTEAATAMTLRFVEMFDESPSAPYHVGGFDAYHILLDAIEAVAQVAEDGTLMIDRTALRDYVNAVEGYEGVSGTISCNPGGECLAARSGIYRIEAGAVEMLEVYGAAADAG